MDIISAMDRSAMDRFSWNYADTIVESSWKILATFEREKSLFIQEDSRIAREVVWGPTPPFFLRKIGGDGRHFVGEYRQMLFGPLGWVLPRKQKLSCAQIVDRKTPPFNGVWGQIFVGWILPLQMVITAPALGGDKGRGSSPPFICSSCV